MKYLLLTSLLALLASPVALADEPLTQARTNEIIQEIDDRQRNGGDWKARIYLEQKEKDKNDVVYDAVSYRRDKDDNLMILFLKPKAERGKGYLRLDKNLWFYDPRVGKWERRTERERIGGTDSNRADFDQSRLADEFDGTFKKQVKIGKYQAYQFELKAKTGVDVAYPKIALWVDKATLNVLKRIDYAASGKKMRRALYPKWQTVFSPSKNTNVWFPKEIYIFDEIEKGNKTVVLIREVDLNPLPPNIFTKAWLESKSR